MGINYEWEFILFVGEKIKKKCVLWLFGVIF